MGRTQSYGIDFFSFDVDFFEKDRKIKVLRARYGADGIELLIYLLCCIYREGYYLKVDKDFEFCISDDLNMNSDKVQQILTFLLERSMFDEQLFKSDAVLTSHGIQERWQKAVKTRAAKTPIEIHDYWLLSKEETADFIKYTLFDNSSEKKDNSSEKKGNSSLEENTKESKVKKSKVNSIHTEQCDEEMKSFFEKHSEIQVDITSTAMLGDIDYSLLEQKISESRFLKEQKSLCFFIRNWKKIKADSYKDFEFSNRPKKEGAVDQINRLMKKYEEEDEANGS